MLPDAAQFIMQKIVLQADLEGVSLSEVDQKMLPFSETSYCVRSCERERGVRSAADMGHRSLQVAARRGYLSALRVSRSFARRLQYARLCSALLQ